MVIETKYTKLNHIFTIWRFHFTFFEFESTEDTEVPELVRDNEE
jgi:hypothetical protein